MLNYSVAELREKINQKGDSCKKKIANEEIMCNFVAVWKR